MLSRPLSIGDRPLASVRPSEVQAMVKALSATLAPGTVEVVYRYLVAIFRSAVADRLIAASPCTGVKLPKVEPVQVVPPMVEAIESVAEALPGRYKGLVLLAAGTRLRQGEWFGLTLDRVDFPRHPVKVDRQLVPGPGPALGPPKTNASYRTVPLPDVVLEVLATHLAAYPASVDGLVFTNDRASPSAEPGSPTCGARRWRRPVRWGCIFTTSGTSTSRSSSATVSR